MKKRTFKKLAQEAWDRAARPLKDATCDADALSDQCSCEDCQDSIVDSVIPKPKEPLYLAMTNEVRFTYQALRAFLPTVDCAGRPLHGLDNTTLQLAWDIVRNARNR